MNFLSLWGHLNIPKNIRNKTFSFCKLRHFYLFLWNQISTEDLQVYINCLLYDCCRKKNPLLSCDETGTILMILLVKILHGKEFHLKKGRLSVNFSGKKNSLYPNSAKILGFLLLGKTKPLEWVKLECWIGLCKINIKTIITSWRLLAECISDARWQTFVSHQIYKTKTLWHRFKTSTTTAVQTQGTHDKY